MNSSVQARIIYQIDDIQASEWNDLTDSKYPFLRHEFLSALETHDCLGEKTGWLPHHIVFEDKAGKLAAALPMYLKYNSFGEFVFDWTWADAYQRAGQEYYPKLVVASPFTPATGPRLLISKNFNSNDFRIFVIETTIQIAESLNVSSLHILFTTDSQKSIIPHILRRVGCQFHWQNKGYLDFDDFLSTLMSKKRKNIRYERRLVQQPHIDIRLIPGSQVSDKEWEVFHTLYRSTFLRHMNYPALTEAFFKQIACTMGDQIRLVLAYRKTKIVAASYFFLGSDTLYGRYWGCFEDIPGLHFEACYYQGLEYCIQHQLQRFEPGAQGEHKISRGFLPTTTYSFHWIKDLRFRTAISNFLNEEAEHTHRYIAELNAHSPFKHAID